MIDQPPLLAPHRQSWFIDDRLHIITDSLRCTLMPSTIWP